RLVSHLLCTFLHLTGIVNAHLLFGRQRQSSPDACISQRSLFVRMERDFDLDSALNRGGITTRRLCSFFKGWQQLIAVQLIALARRANEAISGSACKSRGNGTTRTDIDGDRLIGLIIN